MMARILLIVLYLTGWLTISTCIVYQYFTFSSLQTWGDAQIFCRQKYKDLVTFENTEEINFISSTVSSTFNISDVWIGLICDFKESWSDAIQDSILNWETQARNDPLFPYLYCGSVSKDGFEYEQCPVNHPFICHNGTQLVFVNETVDWFSAWKYCRENFTDLTSPLYPPWNSSLNTTWTTDVQNIVPSGCQAWIGMYKYPFSFWSDGSASSFRYWDDLQAPSAWAPRMYGVANLQKSGKWRFVLNDLKLPFICYNISEVPSQANTQVQLKSKKVLQLRMNSSVDLNDPVVKLNLLTKLQDRLKEKGISGVTLKWREQPDGKVFLKERKAHDEF